jgi:hypothetical protein
MPYTKKLLSNRKSAKIRTGKMKPVKLFRVGNPRVPKESDADVYNIFVESKKIEP